MDLSSELDWAEITNSPAIVTDPSKADLSSNLLQEFILPSSRCDIELYVKILEGEFIFDDQMISFDKARLSFNTYLNSFYEDYWIKHTSVKNLEFCLEGEGYFRCTIFRETKGLGCFAIDQKLVQLTLKTPVVEMSIPLVSKFHGHGGRLFVDIELLTPSHISSMSWRTRERSLQDVSIGAGLCTFNREPFLLNTVEKLVKAAPEAAIRAVVVVNQGDPLDADAVQKVKQFASCEFNVVEQQNFGGAGGFARSAIELFQRPDITHILFMDDDIELDPRHLTTTAAFLRYALSPLVVGGHMLDLFRKNILYEAGNTISPDNQLHPNHHNLDLKQLSSLTALSRAAASHFNGWWYAATPVECFRAHGLPLPIFIRGDDLEFGTRLHAKGIETVALPPVSVWHEPFYAKAPGWQLYYDLRNRLVFGSINGDRFGLDSPSRLLKLLMVHLIRYDYQQAWFMQQALTDFLKGPALLAEGLPTIHARIMQDSKPLSPIKLKAALGFGEAETTIPQRPWAIRLRMLKSFVRVLAGRPRRRALGVLRSNVPLQWVRVGASYVLSDPDGHFFQQYTYSRPLTWRLLQSGVSAIRRYDKNRATAASAWKAAHPRIVSEAHWRDILGLQSQPVERERAA